MSTEQSERRAAERFLFKASATLQRGASGEIVRAQVVNASANGILFTIKSDTALSVGERVVCHVNLPFGFDIGLPNHAEGSVTRVEGNSVAVSLDGGTGFDLDGGAGF